MRCKKYVARVIAVILAVGMLASSVPSAVYAAENEVGITVDEQKKAAEAEAAGEKTGAEDVQENAPMQEPEAEVGQENAETVPAVSANTASNEETQEETTEKPLETDGAATSGSCGENGDNVTWKLEDGTLVISGSGRMENYRCSDGVEETPWYTCRDDIRQVTIESGVTSIGDDAFYECSSLVSINLPAGLREIGSYAFNNCSSLISIDLPAGLTKIEDGIFWQCSSLTSIDLPAGLTEIGDSALGFCSSLTSIDLPSRLTVIGYNVFNGCSSLTSIDLPEGVTEIGAHAFYNCSSLTSMDLPEGVTEIGDYAFEGCSSLTNIDLPNGLTRIGLQAFYHCSNLTDFEFPAGVKTIGNAAFYYCSSLTSINLPEGVTEIGAHAFSGCSSLANIEIPAGVTEIKNGAFALCGSLTFVEIPSGVTKIGERAFWSCKSLISIEIPSSVTMIGKEAFYECNTLTNIEIPSGVTEIGERAFSNCGSLITLELPAGLKTIGRGAFQNCHSLKHVYYDGSEALWKEVDIGEWNECLTNATIHYNNSDLGTGDTPKPPVNPAPEPEKKYKVYINYPGCEMFDVSLDQKVWRTDATVYDPQLAHMLVAMCNAVHSENDMKATFASFGFEENYTKLDYTMQEVLLAYGLGIKLMDDGTALVLVVTRGTEGVASREFLDNIVRVGANRLGEHSGFSDTASALCDIMQKFLDKKGKELKPDLDTENFSDIKFVLTGHSRGAATVNIIGKRLADKRNGEDGNIYVYTFACPDVAVITDAHAAKYPTIFNIANVEDVVPWMPRAVMPESGEKDGWREDSYWNKYGYSYWFCNNWSKYNKDNPVSIDTVNSLNEIHPQNKYLDYLRLEKDKSEYRTRDKTEEVTDLWFFNAVGNVIDGIHDTAVSNVKFYKILCPVDLEIYSSDGRLVGKIVNNMASDVAEDEICVCVDDDRKYIGLLGQDTYFIKLTGTDTGTMEYAVQDVDIQTFEILAEKSFKNVALTAGKRMTSSVSVWDKTDSSISTEDKIDTSQVRLLVLDDGGNAIKEVLPDGKGTEVPISGGTDGILPEDIPTDGKIPEGLWIASISDITYTGEAVTPDVHVYDGNVRLKENVDYKVSYKNNKNAAKAADVKAPTVTVAGKGNYSGRETATFTILQADIGGSEVFAADFQVKTGNKAVKPVPELYYLGTKLSNNKDFTVTYANTSGVYAQTGEYDVTVTGKGNYTGTRTLKLRAVDEVVKAKPTSLAKASLGGFQQTFVYTGQACRQQCTLKVKMPDGSGRTLTEGTDYTVLYSNNKKAGKATVTYCGRNGYTGKLKKAYKILPYNIQENDGGKIQYAVKECVFAKGGSKPKPDIRFNGTLLREGMDYTLSYQNNKAVGGSSTPTVTVTGKGSFTGKIPIPFTITPQNLENMTLVSGDKVYKNKADIYRITPKLMDLDGKMLTAGKDFDKNSITYVYGEGVALENGVSKKAGDAVEATDIIPADTRIRITLAKGSGSDYTGTYVGSYRIAKADIGSAKVTIPKQIYTGRQIRPDQTQITVKLGGKTLSPEDYRIVRYENNVDKGKASVVLAGEGNYGGVKTVSFTIMAKGFLWWWRPAARWSFSA